MSSNYADWMQKTVETEARDWRRPVVPETDGDGHYHTESIVIIFQVRKFIYLFSVPYKISAYTVIFQLLSRNFCYNLFMVFLLIRFSK